MLSIAPIIDLETYTLGVEILPWCVIVSTGAY